MVEGTWGGDWLVGEGRGRLRICPPFAQGWYEGSLRGQPPAPGPGASTRQDASIRAEGYGRFTTDPSPLLSELGRLAKRAEALAAADEETPVRGSTEAGRDRRAQGGRSPAQAAPGRRSSTRGRSAATAPGVRAREPTRPDEGAGSVLQGDFRHGSPWAVGSGQWPGLGPGLVEEGLGWWHQAHGSDGGWSYLGPWSQGLRHGLAGVCVYWETAPADSPEAPSRSGSPPALVSTMRPKAIFRGCWRRGAWAGKGILWIPQMGRVYRGVLEGGMDHCTALVTAHGDADSTADVVFSYEGHLVSGERHGQGRSEENAAVYEGVWAEDKPNGLGRRVEARGTFEGTFIEGVPNGPGILRTGSRVFRGQWVDGVMHGRGRTLVRLDAAPAAADTAPTTVAKADRSSGAGDGWAWVEGHWEKGVLDKASTDRGTAPVDGEGTFEGGLFDGRPNGPGVAQWPNGDMMKATWIMGTLDAAAGGVCRRTLDMGLYIGEFRGGTLHAPTPHGRGVLEAPSGDRLEGTWMEGLPYDCSGAFTAHGQHYEGSWRKGARHGPGRLRWSSGEEYAGQFEDGLPHGRGTKTTASGVYAGEWRSGVPHGAGRFTFATGHVVDGTWDEGRQVVD